MITTVLIFILVLGVLVFVHELGHFLVAKKSGMTVHEFGFGFPPRIFGVQKVDGKWKLVWGRKHQDSEDTVYSVNWIPLGGFVKILGEDNDTTNDPKSFVNKPFWIRFLSLSAGVIMNFLLAGLIFAISFMVGYPAAIGGMDDIPKGARFYNQGVVIVEVEKDSIAEKSGLQTGDHIVTINGESFAYLEDVQAYLKSHLDQDLSLAVTGIAGDRQVIVHTPKEHDQVVGVALSQFGKVKYGFFTSIWQGYANAVGQISAMAEGLYKIFASGNGINSLGGPVKIAQLTGKVASAGIIPLINFAGFLSLNLALLNALPFPALDGGRILFLIIEKIRRKKNNVKVEQYANAIGFLALLLLMLIITVKDVAQLEAIKNLFH